MEYLIVEDGVIENIIVCESDSVASQLGAVPCYTGALVGAEYKNPASQEARDAKETELSAACNAAIENGLDIQLGDTTEHFNYSEKDQLNIKEMFDAVRMGATEYPYQSDTGECRVYSADEIKLIYQTLAGHKTGNLTYYHQLKSYVGTLETEDEVNAVVYGQPLTGEYLTHYNDMMAVVQAQMAAVLSAG